MLSSSWRIVSRIRIVFKKIGKILRITLAEREGAMPPVAPPVTTPMIHYHFLIVKTHHLGRLYQHHLFRFTPKVGPNKKMAPPSRAKGGAMTPVALPPPLRSPVPRTSTYRSGTLRKPTRKDGPPQNETMLPNGALNNIQLPGHVVRNNRNGPH